MTAKNSDLPFPTLLSQVLVAFTIEFDNEAEHQLPHRTTKHGSTGSTSNLHRLWLVSMAMWTNCMQFIGEEGLRLGELEDLARTVTNLNGMRRWGYILIETEAVPGGPKLPRSQWLIRSTPAGQAAQKIWRPLAGVIEQRWRDRFGDDRVSQLRSTLERLVEKLDPSLPDCMPILEYGLYGRTLSRSRRKPALREAAADLHLPLPALLSRTLLAFALAVESESGVSIAIGANILRFLDKKPVRVRDLPLLTGVSKESINMALGVLVKRKLVIVEADQTASRTKVGRLTAKGQETKDTFMHLLRDVEQRWHSQFGDEIIRALRDSLAALVGDATPLSSPLFQALTPYPDGWRAALPAPKTLPHFPLVLHRGGFPDGS